MFIFEFRFVYVFENSHARNRPRTHSPHSLVQSIGPENNAAAGVRDFRRVWSIQGRRKWNFIFLFALYPRRSLPDDASAKLVRKRRSKWKKFLMSLPNGIKSVVSRNHYYRSMTFPTTDDDSGGHLAPASLKEKSTNTRSSPDIQTAKEQRNERKIETSCRRPTPTKIFRVLFYFYIPHTPRNR